MSDIASLHSATKASPGQISTDLGYGRHWVPPPNTEGLLCVRELSIDRRRLSHGCDMVFLIGEENELKGDGVLDWRTDARRERPLRRDLGDGSVTPEW